MHLFSVTSANIAVNCRKLDFDYITVGDRMGLSQPLLHNSTEVGEIPQNNGNYAVQGHSRSPILIPIKRAYVNSYL